MATRSTFRANTSAETAVSHTQAQAQAWGGRWSWQPRHLDAKKYLVHHSNTHRVGLAPSPKFIASEQNTDQRSSKGRPKQHFSGQHAPCSMLQLA